MIVDNNLIYNMWRKFIDIINTYQLNNSDGDFKLMSLWKTCTVGAWSCAHPHVFSWGRRQDRQDWSKRITDKVSRHLHIAWNTMLTTTKTLSLIFCIDLALESTIYHCFTGLFKETNSLSLYCFWVKFPTILCQTTDIHTYFKNPFHGEQYIF